MTLGLPEKRAGDEVGPTALELELELDIDIDIDKPDDAPMLTGVPRL